MIIFAIVIVICLPLSHHANLSEATDINKPDYRRELLHNILNRSEKYLAPMLGTSSYTDVYLNLALYQIIEVDQKLNNINVALAVELYWYNDRLQWDPNDFGNIDYLYVPADIVWTPEFIVTYSVDPTNVVPVQRTGLSLRSNGEADLFLSFTTRALCTFNLQLFPFDTQQCNVTFSSFGQSHLRFRVGRNKVHLASFYDNQEWMLKDARLVGHVDTWTGEEDSTYYMVVGQLMITRQPFFYIFNRVIPMTITVFLVLIAFHMPGPTISPEIFFLLSFDSMFTIIILLISTTEEMPKFSLKPEMGNRGSFSGLPLLCIYYLSLICLIAVAAVLTAGISTLEKSTNNDEKVHSWSLLLIGRLFAGQFPRNKEQPAEVQDAKMKHAENNQSFSEVDTISEDRESGYLSKRFESIQLSVELLLETVASQEKELNELRQKFEKDSKIRKYWRKAFKRSYIASFFLTEFCLGVSTLLFFMNTWYARSVPMSSYVD